MGTVTTEYLEKLYLKAGADAARASKLARETAGESAGEKDSLVEAAAEIRSEGRWPYYTSKAVAADIFANRRESAETLGIKEAAVKLTDMREKPELTQLIADHYKKISAGDWNEDEKKVSVMRRAYELGYRNEIVYQGCCQCTLATMYELFGNKDLRQFRAATGFSAGMSICGDCSCGGYSGGIMYLGNFAGRRFEFFDGDVEEKQLSNLLTGKLHERYVETYGSVICHEIHKDIFGRKFYIREPEQRAGFEAAGAHSGDKCPAVVGTACSWVAEIILDNKLAEPIIQP